MGVTQAPAIESSPGKDGPDVVRRRDVDGLGGVAILAVLAFHFFPDVVKGGFVGVDVFFVISGFVITNLLLVRPATSASSMALFWGRRVRRLFPSLAVVLLFTLVAGWFVFWPAQFAETGQATAWSSAMLGNVYAWLGAGYFAAEPTYNPLLNLWSLGVEEQFYVVWPVLVFVTLLVWRRRFALIVALLGVFSWLLAVVFVSQRGGADSALSAVFYLPWFRAWEFCAGALVAAVGVLWPRAGRAEGPAPWHPWAYVGLATVLGVSLVVQPGSLNPAFFAAPAVAATAGLIFLGSFGGRVTSVMANGPLLWFGKISYPLYLWHWPILSLGLALGLSLSVGNAVAMIAISVVLGYVSWRLIEGPIRRRPITWRLVVSLVVPIVLIGLAGYAVGKLQGLPERGSEVARQLNAFTYDPAQDLRLGTCFTEDGATDTRAVLEDCVEAQPGKENVLLWGDSYAAHLYPGLRDALSPETTLSQVTASSCLPEWRSTDEAVSPCVQENELASSLIAEDRFDAIVISGFWREGDSERLASTLDRVRSATDATVIVVGAFPQWSPSLPRNWSFLEASRMQEVPQYAVPDRLDSRVRLSAELAEVARSHGALFFDPLDSLCNESGCLVRTGVGVDSLVAWDAGHLTRDGSLFVGPVLAEVVER